MAPGPSLQDLIVSVRADAAGADALDQLMAASRTVAELEEVADAVLAHFVDQCRRSGRSWSEISRALGVTKQAAHKRFSLTTPSLERFTPRARGVLTGAGEAARWLGHNYVGTEHLLLGLLADPEALAARVLAEVKVTRTGVEQQIPRSSPLRSPTDEAPPFTPRAADCIAKAVAEALQLGHNYVGTEHLLLALFADPEALAAKILTESGATYDNLRGRVIERLSGYTRPRL